MEDSSLKNKKDSCNATIYHTNFLAEKQPPKYRKIALRIAATATEILFSAARPILRRELSSAPTPFLRLRPGWGVLNRGTDDAVHLYRYQYSIISEENCQ